MVLFARFLGGKPLTPAFRQVAAQHKVLFTIKEWRVGFPVLALFVKNETNIKG